MTGLWNVLLPESAAVTNLVTNPSFETVTTGYTAVGGSIAASTTYARRGYKSLAVTCTTAGTDGVFYDALALTSGTTYAFSHDLRGTNGVGYLSYLADTAGTAVSTQTATTGTGAWARPVVIYSASATGNFRLYITKASGEDTGPFYVDGVQVIASTYDQTYIDGTQEDCAWNGTAHASTSYRKAGSRAGGRLVNFDSYEFYTDDFTGAGMAEVDPLYTPLAVLPGVEDAGESIRERRFDLVGTVSGATLPGLHTNRQSLIDAFKSDRVKGKQLFKLAYTGAGNTVYTKARYTGGLSFGSLDGFSERLALRFLSPDPFWYEDGNESAVMTGSAAVADANYVLERRSGVWSNISSGFNSTVNAIAKGNNGNIYIGGNFTAVGSTDGNYILEYNPTTGAVSSLGTGAAGGAVQTINVAPNGDVYIGGFFTSVGGVANTARIAKWDGTQWLEVGGGIASGSVETMAFASDGKLYIGGQFTAHGDTDGNRITVWDGSAYASLGTGMNNIVYSIVIDARDTVYVGGSFTSAGGVADTGYLATWDGSTWAGLSGGQPSAAVFALAFASNGVLYAGGTFTSAGGVDAVKIARYNGSNWEAVGDANDSVLKLYYADGKLYAAGYFTIIGGVVVSSAAFGGYAVYNGTSWGRIDIILSGGVPSSYINAVLVDGENLYIGSNTDTAVAATGTTVTNNGTAQAYPKFVINRSGGTSSNLAYLKNETTGATIYFDYSLQDGETLTVDFALGNRSITSSYYGNVIGRAMLRNSDFSEFFLLPGANVISLFTVDAGSPTVTAYMTWPIAHWSIDGGA